MAEKVEYIEAVDKLNTGRKKINDFAIAPALRAEQNSNNALNIANNSNDTANDAKDIAANTDIRLDNIIASEMQDGEVVDARKPFGEESFPTLGNRLDNQIGKNSEFRDFELDKSFMSRVFNESSERGINIKWLGLKPEPGFDNAVPLAAFFSDNKETVQLLIPPGSFEFLTDVEIPENITLQFINGGNLKPMSGVDLKINGVIVAGDYQIFEDGGGTVAKQLSPSHYNLAWYEGQSINKKYDFARRDFMEFKTKTIIVPRPAIGRPGTYTDSGNRTFWLCDGPILIDDSGNSAEWYIYGEFIAQSSFEAFIKISGPNKPENVYFYGTVQLYVPSESEFMVECGIHVLEGARINFYDQVVINGCNTSVLVGGDGQKAPASAMFNILQCSFFSESGVKVDGNFSNASTIYVEDLSMTGCTTAGSDGVFLTGVLRDLYFGRILYSTESKDGYTSFDLENVVHITSRGTQTIQRGNINYIATLNANTCVAIDAGADNAAGVQFLTFGTIIKKFNGNAFKINYCSYVDIKRIFNGAGLSVFGQNTSACTIAKNNLEKITDLGSNNLIGNVGKQARGGGVAPSPAVSWPIGSIIREATDGKLYLRVDNTGSANDFIVLN